MPHIVTEKELLIPSPIQEINSPFLSKKGVRLLIKRDDLIHPEISGNKWRKLKFAIKHCKEQQLEGIVTFGGAYSNHIVATAAACKMFGLHAIGFIRGEELQPENHSLKTAQNFGMQFQFVSREDYKQKTEEEFLFKLKKKYPNFLLIPEGGYTKWALKGVAEILTEIDSPIDYISTACGTGATAAGLCLAEKAKVLGFPVLKNGEFIQNEVEQLLGYTPNNFKLFTDYHFGGYAKIKGDLIRFKDYFESESNIALDCVYTAKHFYGIFDLIKKGFFTPASTLVALHTGGLQGNQSMTDKIAKMQKTESYFKTQFDFL